MAKTATPTTFSPIAITTDVPHNGTMLKAVAQAVNHAINFYAPNIICLGSERSPFFTAGFTKGIYCPISIPSIATEVEFAMIIDSDGGDRGTGTLSVTVGGASSFTVNVGSSYDTDVQSTTLDTADTGTGDQDLVITASLTAGGVSGEPTVRAIYLGVRPIANHITPPSPVG